MIPASGPADLAVIVDQFVRRDYQMPPDGYMVIVGFDAASRILGTVRARMPDPAAPEVVVRQSGRATYELLHEPWDGLAAVAIVAFGREDVAGPMVDVTARTLTQIHELPLVDGIRVEHGRAWSYADPDQWPGGQEIDPLSDVAIHLATEMARQSQI